MVMAVGCSADRGGADTCDTRLRWGLMSARRIGAESVRTWTRTLNRLLIAADDIGGVSG
jgi:hypothetical protein